MAQTGPANEVKVRVSDIRALHARIERLEQNMKAELDKKVDTRVAEVEINQLKASVGKHECQQVASIAVMSTSMSAIEKSIHNIEGSLGRWKTFRVSGVLAIILAIISGAGYILTTDSKVESVKMSVKRIEEDMAEVMSQIKEMKADPYTASQTLDTIRDTIKEELARRP